MIRQILLVAAFCGCCVASFAQSSRLAYPSFNDAFGYFQVFAGGRYGRLSAPQLSVPDSFLAKPGGQLIGWLGDVLYQSKAAKGGTFDIKYCRRPSNDSLRFAFAVSRAISAANGNGTLTPLEAYTKGLQLPDDSIGLALIVYYKWMKEGFNVNNIESYSGRNLELSKWGLKSTQERAIAFAELTDGLITSMRVTIFTKHDSITLSTFRCGLLVDGKPYWAYTDFEGISDFLNSNYINYPWYFRSYFSNYYHVLNQVLRLIVTSKGPDVVERRAEAKRLLEESIFLREEYYALTPFANDLKTLRSDYVRLLKQL